MAIHEHDFFCVHDEQQCDGECSLTHECRICHKTVLQLRGESHLSRRMTELPEDLRLRYFELEDWINVSGTTMPEECSLRWEHGLIERIAKLCLQIKGLKS